MLTRLGLDLGVGRKERGEKYLTARQVEVRAGVPHGAAPTPPRCSPGSQSWVLAQGGSKRPWNRFTPPPHSRRFQEQGNLCSQVHAEEKVWRERQTGTRKQRGPPSPRRATTRAHKFLLTLITRHPVLTAPLPPRPGSSETEVAAEIQGRKRRGEGAVILLKARPKGEEWSTSRRHLKLPGAGWAAVCGGREGE